MGKLFHLNSTFICKKLPIFSLNMYFLTVRSIGVMSVGKGGNFKGVKLTQFRIETGKLS